MSGGRHDAKQSHERTLVAHLQQAREHDVSQLLHDLAHQSQGQVFKQLDDGLEQPLDRVSVEFALLVSQLGDEQVEAVLLAEEGDVGGEERGLPVQALCEANE